MTLSFRELTNNECLVNREMIREDLKRTELERQVLANLDAAKAAYTGPIKQCPSGATTEHIPELNLACKKRRETASKGGEAAKVAKRQKA